MGIISQPLKHCGKGVNIKQKSYRLQFINTIFIPFFFYVVTFIHEMVSFTKLLFFAITSASVVLILL